MFKNLKLKTKLLIAFLSVGTIPFAIVSIISMNQMSNSLSKQIFSQLVSIRDIKKLQVENYLKTIKNQIRTFSENFMIVEAMHQFDHSFDSFITDNQLHAKDLKNQRKHLKTYYTKDFSNAYREQNERSPNIDQIFGELDNKAVALQYRYIKDNPNPLGSKDSLDKALDQSKYSEFHGKYHPIIRSYLKKFGYYDIFLVDPKNGKVIYSVFKELDYATSLINGPYANSGLAEAFRLANKAKSPDFVGFTDFKQYFPSYEAPAGFVSSPIYKDQQKVGILIFQFPMDNLNRIMKARNGMGKTGETYMVGHDFLMRSDSFQDPVNHSVVASFRHPEKGKVKTLSVKKALNGKSGNKIIRDYKGNWVLSAYAPMNLSGLNWAFLAEISEAEAFENIKTLKRVSGIIGVICIISIVSLSLFITLSIVKPIQGVVTNLTDLSQGEGDLTTRLAVASNDEVGDLSIRFNEFMEKLKDMVTKIVKGVETLSSSSTELSAISEQMSTNSKQTSQKSDVVFQSAKDMSENMNSISAAMEESNTNSSMLATSAEQMTSTINEIAENTDKARSISVEAVEESREVSQQMAELGNAAKSIDQVTETITEISEQTNLLALNATIEAARAGESGKGFAVVANEIKELARQTTEATLDIRQKIDSIQKVTGRSVLSIEKISKVIEEINTIISTIATAIEEQSASTREIANNISQISQGINEANQNIAQSSKVTQDITQDINEVNLASNDIANSSSQIRLSADELSELANHLNVLVRRFKV